MCRVKVEDNTDVNEVLVEVGVSKRDLEGCEKGIDQEKERTEEMDRR